mgnify:FL=1
MSTVPILRIFIFFDNFSIHNYIKYIDVNLLFIYIIERSCKMNLEGKKIGFALTGSFCTFKKTIEQIEKLKEINNIDIFPIMSFNSYNLDLSLIHI